MSVTTKAKPKIAAYQFTTLTPNLGMVILPDGRDFSMADLPGLIEGASQGVGLGIQFLRHVERTKVILHLVSMDPNNGRKAIDDYHTIRKELQNYETDLSKKRELIVASQMDIPSAEDKLKEFKEALQKEGNDEPVYEISSVTHQGVSKLMSDTANLVAEVEEERAQEEPKTVEKTKEYKYKAPQKNEFTVERVGEHEFVVKGEQLERLVQMTNLDHQDGIMRLARRLKRLGVDDALREKGAVNGDDVAIGKFVFEFVQ